MSSRRTNAAGDPGQSHLTQGQALRVRVSLQAGRMPGRSEEKMVLSDDQQLPVRQPGNSRQGLQTDLSILRIGPWKGLDSYSMEGRRERKKGWKERQKEEG